MKLYKIADLVNWQDPNVSKNIKPFWNMLYGVT